MLLQNSQLPNTNFTNVAVLAALSGISDIVPTVLGAPSPQVTTCGLTGSTTYSYIVASLGIAGQAPCVAVTITTGYATLSATNYNNITWGPVPGVMGYAVYRSAGGGNQGLIALIAANQLQTPAVGLFGLTSYFQVQDTGLGATAASAGGPTGNTTGCVQMQSPIFSLGPVFEGPAPVAISATTGQTLTAAQFLNPMIVRSGPTATFNDTTPTAAPLVAAFPGVQAGCQTQTMYRNQSSYTSTLVAGSGVTLATGNTNTTATVSTHLWWIVFTNVTPGSEAVTVYSLGTFTF